ncbi:hypothetical protein E2C01_072404 [Portunus trituberculatus]|uniref:Uncharacterized protein n=1 Tax=Portunus trituberculatus TaxID=210409 RepID=A0A5B7I729_PORTR|nr:hypothetical protein [Portunus trituberculatus]
MQKKGMTKGKIYGWSEGRHDAGDVRNGRGKIRSKLKTRDPLQGVLMEAGERKHMHHSLAIDELGRWRGTDGQRRREWRGERKAFIFFPYEMMMLIR